MLQLQALRSYSTADSFIYITKEPPVQQREQANTILEQTAVSISYVQLIQNLPTKIVYIEQTNKSMTKRLFVVAYTFNDEYII